MSADPIDFATGAPVSGAPEPSWIHGAKKRGKCADPPIQVHQHDRHTYLFRQSKAVNYEAPFMFLLLGNERALLLDTGATADPSRLPLRETIDGLITRWPRPGSYVHDDFIIWHGTGKTLVARQLLRLLFNKASNLIPG
jgi:hydroxyacylglutathione hydrolase